MSVFKNEDGKRVLLAMVKSIQDNRAYLGEIDGLIGDGDHGMNMNKGFSLFETRFQDEEFTFAEGLDELGTILITEIGGSMGPIYGTILMDMGEAGEDYDVIGVAELGNMLQSGLNGLQEIVEAKVGDKTVVDTLSPAVDALQDAETKGLDMATALENLKIAVEEGKNSTKDMVAKHGRSSRLGERSRGVLDAGATSCCILLTAMANEIIAILK